MVSTVVEVCNLALRKVDAARTITGFGEGTLESECCEQFYQPTLSEMLADHPWRFAEYMESLAQTTARPGWTYAYTQPSNFARYILAASNRYMRGAAYFDFQREGGLFLSDSSEFWLKYVRTDPDIILWPPKFLEAVTLGIASKMVGPLKRSRVNAQELADAADVALGKAKHTNDAVERPKESLPESSWVTARGGDTDTWGS